MNKQQLIQECTFKAVRSSGAGGQHVNKVASKIVLSFDVEHSIGLSDDEKALIFKNLSNRLNKDSVLILFCDESRSQHQNKAIVIERFLALLTKAVIIPKQRKATKPSRASVLKKAQNKQRQSLKKALRKKPPLD